MTGWHKALYGAASASVLLMAAAGPAMAQSAPQNPQDEATEVDELVVTGYRQSLRTSLEAKEDAPNVVEVLSSEDIGKLPDLSIAESLARLPGLAGNRDRGNATSISIRGMGPEFVNTLINGRELASAEASRNVRYEQFPAELINGAYVYKSPTAMQAEGAIAGQVNLLTLRPLDFSERRLSFNIRGSYSDLAGDIPAADEYGWIGSAAYIDQSQDGTLGWAFGVSARSENVATMRADIYPYTNSFQDIDGNGDFDEEVPYGFAALERGGTDERIGALGTVQWRPNNDLEIVVDLLYSTLQYEETQNGFEVNGLPFGNWIPGTPTVVNNGLIGVTQYRNWAASSGFGLVPSTTSQYYTFQDDLWSGGVNAEYRRGAWTLTGDVGYSVTNRDQIYALARTSPRASDLEGYTVSWGSVDDGPPILGFDRPLNDPNTQVLYEVSAPQGPEINDELLTLSGEAMYEPASETVQAIRFGVRATDRTKDFTAKSQFLFNYNVFDQAAPVTLVPSQFRLADTRFENFGNYPDALAIDVLGLIDSLGGFNLTTSQDDLGRSWEVKERTAAAYVQADMVGMMGDIEVLGNVGVRVVRTETESNGFDVVNNNGTVTVTPISITNDFVDVLPNLNLTFKLGEGRQFRFGLSRAIARPGLDDLRPSVNTYIFGAPAAFGGNPLLEPYRANQVDLTYEHYFNADTAITVALFYKDLDSFIANQVTQTNSNVGGIPTAGTLQKPINGEGGMIQGFEISYQQAFTFLPGLLDGLGIYANYSRTESDVSFSEADNPITGIPLPGLSEDVANVSLYYYKNGFETRVAYRYRSEYATNIGGQNQVTFNRDDALLDFFASYTFPEASPLKGATISFQANNLTDEPFQTYSGFEERSSRYEEFGRRYWLGLSYAF
ncbi:TonB-dependent receptor [Brevundimonas sp.]|uniref:TonB-dependent receptor n=1 Tax=Brevundimonas sp. TaxID=1871086 RepID=UPI002ABB3798|nr:TonB-dependent receptor [Brevundimonas sp.]MDZ4362848.1 TonB-dependent receptor [Brevundimonas sp.]